MADQGRGRLVDVHEALQRTLEDEDNDDVFVECEPAVVYCATDRPTAYRSSGSLDSTSSETSPFHRTTMDICISSTRQSHIRQQRQFHQEEDELVSANRDSKFITEAIHSEKEFLNYLMSLPTTETSATSPTRCRRSKTVTAASSENIRTQTEGSSDTPKPKVGLDHLDNLCKLMEQLGDLRKKNVKLQKRVQYLEELRTLNELRKELREAVQTSLQSQQPISSTSVTKSSDSQHQSVRITLQHDLEEQGKEGRTRHRPSRSRRPVEDTTWYGSDETLLDKDTGPITTSKGSGKAYSRLRRSLMRRRTRSKSVGNVEMGAHGDGYKSKISRWTKVREALKWERAQVGQHPPGTAFYIDVSSSRTPTPNAIAVPGPGAGGSGSSPASSTVGCAGDSGVCLSEDGVLHPTQLEPQISPQTNQDLDLTLISLGLHPMDDGDLLLAKYLEENALLDDSSSDESVHGECAIIDVEESNLMQRRQSSPFHVYSTRELLVDEESGRKGKSLDRDVDSRMMTKFSQSEKEKKSHKTPWGRVKNIIQIRKDSLKRKQRKNTPYDTEPIDDEDGEITARPISAGEMDMEEEEEDDDVQVSKPKPTTKVKRRPVPIDITPLELSEPPRKATRPGTCSHSPSEENVLCSAGAYSPPTQHRKSKWTRMKKALLSKREVEEESAEGRTQSVPSSPTVAVAFSYDDLALMDDDEAPTIRGRKGSRSNSNLAERSAELERNLAELQRNLSEDFSRKLEEWEQKRGSKRSSSTTLVSSSSSSGVHQRPASPPKPYGHHLATTANQKAPSLRKGKTDSRETKTESRDTKIVKQKEKELQWLEKQLQKVEREKQRLAKERQKYLEREARLEKLRESVITSTASGKSGRQEVLVKTAAGEFRFAGISKTFTRKLYEWEEMKGIGPEVSTIALLNPTYKSGGSGSLETSQDIIKPRKSQRTTVQDNLLPPKASSGFGRLDRNRSRSESSLVDLANVQTSTTSLVGMRGHEDEEYELFSRIGGSSKATSEPDISNIGVDSKPRSSPPCAIEVEEMHIEEMSPCVEIPEVSVEEPVYSYAPPEVTSIAALEVEVSNGRNICENRGTIVQDSYSNLIDENMDLMKRLRDKEEICQKLEKDLENLETKMNSMTSHRVNNNSDTNKMDVPRKLNDAETVEESQRENLEKILRHQRTQQESIAQKLVEKLSELQNTQLNVNPFELQIQKAQAQNPSIPQQQSCISPGVHKIQELSGDLYIQAKRLEQALLERNATIRNLRWELLKRDMNVLPESPQTKPHTEYMRPCIRKVTHSRMWSSLDATLMSDIDKERRQSASSQKVRTTSYKPLQTVDSVELEILPQQLTAKVQDLKDELERLWSSLGTTLQVTTMSTVGNTDSLTIEESNLAEKGPTDTEITVFGQDPEKSVFKELTTRRVSDTCITSDLKSNQLEIVSLSKPARKFAPNKAKPSPFDKNPESNTRAIDDETSSDSASEETAGVTMNLRTTTSRPSQLQIGLRSPSRVPRCLSTPVKPVRITKYPPDASPTAPWRKPRPLITMDPGPATAPAIMTTVQSPPPPWRNRVTVPENFPEKDSGPDTPVIKSRSSRRLKPPTKTPLTSTESLSVSPPTPPTRTKSSFPRTIRPLGKDPAPNIKLMIEKFNQKVEVASQDTRKSSKSLSAGSSETKIPFLSGGSGKGLKVAEPSSPGEGVIQKSVSFSSALPQQRTASSPSTNQKQPRETVKKSESAGSFPSKTPSPRVTRAPLSGPPPSPGSLSRIPRPPGPPPPSIPSTPTTDIPKPIVTIPEVIIAITTKTIPSSTPPTPPPRDDSNHPGNGNRAWQLKKAREEFLSRIPSPSTERKLHLPQPLEPEVTPQPQLPTRKESLKKIPSDKCRKSKEAEKIAKGILKTWRSSFPKGVDNESGGDEKENKPHDNGGGDDDDDLDDYKGISVPSGLLKSASAGMIDAEATAAIFKRMSSQMSEASTTSTTSGDDVSGIATSTDNQPQTQHRQHKSGIFGFRFRKCKLKKKDSDPLPAVKALCRQSLFVDLSVSERKEIHHQQPEARSCPSSPELKIRHRDKASWFSKPKGLFRGK